MAVSGGADSVALLRALVRLSARYQAAIPEWICAAHLNHEWRGEESDSDQYFVEDLCQQLGITLYSARGSETLRGSPTTANLRTEEAAREIRYQFLSKTAYACGARYVATAHTASDRVETMLHNLFRGTGLAGVSAPTRMREFDDELVLVRPLLTCSREDVLNYLQALGQPFRTDSSNADVTFCRNFIRQRLLPLVSQQYGPSVVDKLLSFSEIAEEAHELQQLLAHQYLEQAESLPCDAGRQLGANARNAFSFPSKSKLPTAWPIVRLAIITSWQDRGWPLQKMSRKHWQLVREVWENGTKQNETSLPGDLRLSCKGETILINAHTSRA
ncbi:MAG: tRNA lysidine(34) synthetase TilS [Pirellulaceae bacterium]